MFSNVFFIDISVKAFEVREEQLRRAVLPVFILLVFSMSLHPFEHARLKRRTFRSPRVAPPALISCSLRFNLVITPIARHQLLRERLPQWTRDDCEVVGMPPVLVPCCAELETFGSTCIRAIAPLPCEDVDDAVETTRFLSQTLQSKHESRTSQKEKLHNCNRHCLY